MAAISITAADVRPLNGAIIRRLAAASTNVAVGKAVYIKSDGTIELADADAADTAQARGIVVACGTQGDTTAEVGEMCDVVTHGPVLIGTTGLTDGGAVFVSITAGSMDQTAVAVASGDFSYVIGFAESDSIVYVQPQMTVPTAA